jgi:hypothetical protein
MKDAPGMKGIRSRNSDGELRQKRGDTHVGTIEKEYGVNFGVNSNMHLNTLLQKENTPSLHKLLEKQ